MPSSSSSSSYDRRDAHALFRYHRRMLDRTGRCQHPDRLDRELSPMPDPRLRHMDVCETTPTNLQRRIQGYANGIYRALADLSAGAPVDPERVAVTIRYVQALMNEVDVSGNAMPGEWLAWLDAYERRWDDPDAIAHGPAA